MRREKSAFIRVRKDTRKILKIRAAKLGITMAALLEELSKKEL